MGKIGKTLALLLTLTIAMSALTLLTVKPINAQTTPSPTPYHELPNPSVPEFTLKYIDNSHAVPPTTITTTDTFTGKQEVVTQEGYYIQNASIQIL
jgi:hypothetical protein